MRVLNNEEVQNVVGGSVSVSETGFFWLINIYRKKSEAPDPEPEA